MHVTSGGYRFYEQFFDEHEDDPLRRFKRAANVEVAYFALATAYATSNFTRETQLGFERKIDKISLIEALVAHPEIPKRFIAEINSWLTSPRTIIDEPASNRIITLMTGNENCPPEILESYKSHNCIDVLWQIIGNNNTAIDTLLWMKKTYNKKPFTRSRGNRFEESFYWYLLQYLASK
jgi:hypothetical protein